MIYLADNSDDAMKDDRTLIRVLQDLPPTQPYCVQSFEFTYDDDYVNVYYFPPKGNLDGKVSRIGVWNPRTCPWPEFCYPPGT